MPIPSLNKKVREDTSQNGAPFTGADASIGSLTSREVLSRRNPPEQQDSIPKLLTDIRTLLQRQFKPPTIQKYCRILGTFTGAIIPGMPTTQGFMIADHDDDREQLIIHQTAAGAAAFIRFDDGNFTSAFGGGSPNDSGFFLPPGFPIYIPGSRRVFLAQNGGAPVVSVISVNIDRNPRSTQ